MTTPSPSTPDPVPPAVPVTTPSPSDTKKGGAQKSGSNETDFSTKQATVVSGASSSNLSVAVLRVLVQQFQTLWPLTQSQFILINYALAEIQQPLFEYEQLTAAITAVEKDQAKSEEALSNSWKTLITALVAVAIASVTLGSEHSNLNAGTFITSLGPLAVALYMLARAYGLHATRVIRKLEKKRHAVGQHALLLLESLSRSLEKTKNGSASNGAKSGKEAVDDFRAEMELLYSKITVNVDEIVKKRKKFKTENEEPFSCGWYCIRCWLCCGCCKSTYRGQRLITYNKMILEQEYRTLFTLQRTVIEVPKTPTQNKASGRGPPPKLPTALQGTLIEEPATPEKPKIETEEEKYPKRLSLRPAEAPKRAPEEVLTPEISFYDDDDEEESNIP